MQGRRNILFCRGRTADRRLLLVRVERKNVACSGWKNRLSCLRLHSKENRRIEDFSTQTVRLRRKAFYGASLTYENRVILKMDYQNAASWCFAKQFVRKLNEHLNRRMTIAARFWD